MGQVASADRARRPFRAVNHEAAGRFYPVIARALGVVMRAATKQDWDATPLPDGPLVVAANHISNADPFAVGHYVLWSGRFPRFLAKVEVFRIPVVGWIARNCGQIPVERGTDKAKDSLLAAKDALANGRCVVLYPEGTRTRDPELWPMLGRPGAARLALTTRAPLIPLVNWGAQTLMPGRKLTWPRLFPRKTLRVRALPPVPLDDLYADEPSPAAVTEATRRLMDALTAGVAELRGETPPTGRWDSRLGQRVPIDPPAGG